MGNVGGLGPQKPVQPEDMVTVSHFGFDEETPVRKSTAKTAIYGMQFFSKIASLFSRKQEEASPLKEKELTPISTPSNALSAIAEKASNTVSRLVDRVRGMLSSEPSPKAEEEKGLLTKAGMYLSSSKHWQALSSYSQHELKLKKYAVVTEMAGLETTTMSGSSWNPFSNASRKEKSLTELRSLNRELINAIIQKNAPQEAVVPPIQASSLSSPISSVSMSLKEVTDHVNLQTPNLERRVKSQDRGVLEGAKRDLDRLKELVKSATVQEKSAYNESYKADLLERLNGLSQSCETQLDTLPQFGPHDV